MYYKYVKRFIDIVGSFILLIVFSPILFVLAVCVKWNLGSPVIFRQKRVSKGNRVFLIYKFRTMRELRDAHNRYLSDCQRITNLGKILRSASLDELPELYNILKGDLSFIGPRPLPVEYLSYYEGKELERHNVRGGLIPPEVLYDNIRPTWKEQFTYEIAYANGVSFWMDVKILCSALRNVLRRNQEHYGEYERESFFERDTL